MIKLSRIICVLFFETLYGHPLFSEIIWFDPTIPKDHSSFEKSVRSKRDDHSYGKDLTGHTNGLYGHGNYYSIGNDFNNYNHIDNAHTHELYGGYGYGHYDHSHNHGYGAHDHNSYGYHGHHNDHDHHDHDGHYHSGHYGYHDHDGHDHHDHDGHDHHVHDVQNHHGHDGHNHHHHDEHDHHNNKDSIGYAVSEILSIIPAVASELFGGYAYNHHKLYTDGFYGGGYDKKPGGIIGGVLTSILTGSFDA